MRRIGIVLAVVTMAFVGLGWTAAAHAESNFRTGNDVSVSEGQVIDQTLFAYGRTIDIAGTVQGDVFCAGQDISITGTVTGDVICAGQTVDIAGNVGGNIRVAGQNVTIAGTTARNVTAAGQSISLASSGQVKGDALLGGQSIALNGHIERDLAAAATVLTIDGAVARNVSATTTSLTLGSGATIGGYVSYTSRNMLKRESGAQVVGKVSRETPAHEENGVRFGALIGSGFAAAFYMFAAFLLIALVLILLFPEFIHVATEVAVRAPWKTLLIGFLASFIVPAVVGVLMLTVIGIPLAVLALLAWIVVVCVSVPFAGYYLGSLLISKSTNNPIWIMLLGSAIILVLFMIPFIGFLTWLVAVWFGLGIILLQLTKLPRPQYRIAANKRA